MLLENRPFNPAELRWAFAKGWIGRLGEMYLNRPLGFYFTK